ncbi:MAG: type II secretion system protein GspC [Aquifex sp.]|nr:MAG: type II secretion system protein GspC [Aquifex sp.]
MYFVYALGVAFTLSLILSFLGLYYSFNRALEVKFVPKLKKEEGVNLANLERKLREIFNYSFKEVETTQNFAYSSVSPPPFKVKGIIISEKVKGVILGEESKDVFVSEGQSYKGYRLSKVDRERVVFTKRGKEFPVEFKVEKGSKNLSKVSTYTSSLPSEIVVSRREILELTKDPAKMFTQIRLVPYIKNGKTKGFIFEWVKPGSLFYKLGLRRGDILVSINNTTIRSGEDAFRILQIIRNEPNLKVELIRKGKREEINVRIE